MRKPFRKMPRGMTNTNSTMRRHDVFRNKLAARTLVINSTQLDLMPLHSCATSMVILGSWKMGPARRKGIPLKRKRKLATSADAFFEANSSHSLIESGIGTMKMRYASGKTAACIHARPKKKNPPAARKHKNDEVSNARSSTLAGDCPTKCTQYLNAKTPKPAAKNTIASGRSTP